MKRVFHFGQHAVHRVKGDVWDLGDQRNMIIWLRRRTGQLYCVCVCFAADLELSCILHLLKAPTPTLHQQMTETVKWEGYKYTVDDAGVYFVRQVFRDADGGGLMRKKVARLHDRTKEFKILTVKWAASEQVPYACENGFPCYYLMQPRDGFH